MTGGTGQVGTEVVQALLRERAPTRLLMRSPDKQPPAGVEAVLGTLDDPASLEGAFQGADALFLLTPLSESETQQGLNAVEAAKQAGVGKIVFMTVHHLEEAAHIPHFGSKIPVVDAIKRSGIPWTLIEPNNFFQNDLGVAQAIVEHGIYPQPLGNIGLNRVDTRDIADAVVNALLQPGHEGKSFPLVGPEVLTGEGTADAYSQKLGRLVRYGGDDLDAWAKQVSAFLPEWLVHDLRVMYAHFQDKGLKATEAEIQQAHHIVGHPLRRFDDFITGVFIPASRIGTGA